MNNLGGQIPISPIIPTEPTVQEWLSFMQAIATAGADATVSMVIQDASATPTVADFRVPCAWIKVSPRFAVTPPVVDPPVVTPPPVTYEIMYVTSTTGLNVRETASIYGKFIRKLNYRDQVSVTGSTVVTEKDTTGKTVTYTWADVQGGGKVAREFLSKVQPNP